MSKNKNYDLDEDWDDKDIVERRTLAKLAKTHRELRHMKRGWYEEEFIPETPKSKGRTR